MKCANAVGKMAPLDLLDAELPQTFNLLKKKQTQKPAKLNKAKCSKTRYACIYIS